MSVYLYTQPSKLWTALSTDTKPTTDPRQYVGDMLIETDTGRQFRWDGGAWNYVPSGNNTMDTTLLTLTAQGAGTVVSPDTINSGCRNLIVGVNITAITGTTPTLTVTVQGKDVASGFYFTLLASAALNATGFTLLQMGLGITAAANVAANVIVPRTFRVSAVVGGTTPSVTATIGASLS